jgi:iron complex outermembrane recepter protein
VQAQPVTPVAEPASPAVVRAEPAPVPTAAPASTPAPQKITITGQMIAAPLGAGGFGDMPLARTPLAASIVSEARLRDAGAKSVSDLTRLDAAVSSAYDADGYIPSLSVRGFGVDNRYNVRRDGLPINSETVIALGNKRGIELLKGISGMQAGTSAPGGLLNYVVKRPTSRLHSAMVELRDSGDVAASVDLAARFGNEQALGLRINGSYDKLQPAVRNAQGHRSLVAAAGDVRVSSSALVELEAEVSRQSQPSVPGFSLLGNRLPSAASIDPRINLNHQAWSTPVVFNGSTASLRVTQNLTEPWRLVAHGMTQRLKNDDRVAFPYGCSTENTFDRFCSDGTFDVYDFRSNNERRRSNALDVHAEGTVQAAGMKHTLTAGVLGTQFASHFQRQAFNFAGTDNINATQATPAAPELTDENTNRRERSTELYLRDAVQLAPDWALWLGLRHSRLNRESVRTDGSRATGYAQAFTTPWLALTHQINPQTMLYGSVGQGVESDVAPNRSRYTNAGQALAALKSKQLELGVKHTGDSFDASAAVFDITRPQANDIGACDVAGSCTRRIDGTARHRGAEALLSWHVQNLTLHASGMLLQAKRQGALDAATNGLRPTNVPKQTLRLHGSYSLQGWAADAGLPSIAGATLMASVVHEGNRAALPDNSVTTPGWTRLDLGARWQHPWSGLQLTWRGGVDNATNTRAWKEAPYQFGHAYLFPIAPRTVRLSLQAAF